MRLGKLGLTFLFLGVGLSQQALSLGLGEIKVNSTLNQPLDAEIRLLQVRDLTDQEVLVGIASNEEFSKLGVDRSFFLNNLRFKVVLDNPSGPIVKVTSTEIVREPFLNFLVESQWPSGRVLREYTLLLDLPVFSAQSSPVVQAPAATRNTQTTQAPRTSTAPTTTTSQAAPVTRSTSPTTAANTSAAPVNRGEGGTFGPVQSDDTLWEIAATHRPSSEFSIQQTMIAIQRLNPEAFINGNINLLRKGQVLRLPSEGDLRGLSQTQAVNEVAFQNSQWSSGESYGPGLSATAPTRTPSKTSTSVEGRVSLGVNESPSNTSDSGSARGADSQKVSSLENELAITLEQLDTSKRENTELKSRVSDLEQQIETMERLLSVSNDQLRALQLTSADNANAEIPTDESGLSSEDISETNSEDASNVDDELANSESPTTSVDGSPDVGSDVEDGENGAEYASDDSEVSEAPAPVVQTPPQQNPRTVVTAPPAKQPSFLDFIFDNLYVVGAALLGVLLLVLLLVRRMMAKKAEKEEAIAEEELVNPFESDRAEDDIDDLEMPDDDSFANDFDDQTVRLADNDDTTEPNLSDDEETLSQEALANINPEEVIAEADIYIAYGKYDQAEDMLKRALMAEPGNVDARVKLLEVYAESGNLEKFDQQFEKVHESGDNSGIVRGNQLRSQFANALPYAGMVAAGAALASEDFSSLDLDVDNNEADGFGEIDFSALGDSDQDSESGLLDELSSTEQETEDDDFDFDLMAGDDTKNEEVDDLDFDSFDIDTDFTGASSDSEVAEADGFDLDSDFSSLDEAQEDLVVDQEAEDLSFDLDLDFDNFTNENTESVSIDDGHEVDSSLGENELEDLSFDTDFDGDLDDASLSLDQPESMDLGEIDMSPDLEDDSFDFNLDLDADSSEPVSDVLGVSLDFAGTTDDTDSELDEFDLDLDMDEEATASVDTVETSLDDNDLDMADDSLSAPYSMDLSLDDQPETSEDESDLALDDVDSLELDFEEPTDVVEDELDFATDDLDLGSPESFDAPHSFETTEAFEEESIDLDDGLDLESMDGGELDDSMFADIDNDLAFDEQADESAEEPLLDGDTSDEVVSLEETPELSIEDDSVLELSDLENSLDLEALDEEMEALSSVDIEDELESVDADEKLDDLEGNDPFELDSELDLDEGLAIDDELETIDAELDSDLEDLDVAESEIDIPELSEQDIDLEDLSDDVFDEALASIQDENLDDSAEVEFNELDTEMSFLAGTDESDTKLNLAKAYIDMGDADGARDILDEVLSEGNDQQKQEAEDLMAKIPS
ncbi:motility hub landmark protein FimV [Sessilibacter sp. MAH1]